MVKGYRTIIFNVLMAVIFTANQFMGDTGITEEQINIAADGLNTLIGIVTIIGNVILRTVTTTPVGKKELGIFDSPAKVEYKGSGVDINKD